MMSVIEKSDFIRAITNVKYFKYANKMIKERITKNEEYKELKKSSIISVIIGGIGAAICATVLPIMLPLALPFLITGSIIGGMSGLVGILYLFKSLNSVGKMRQLKETKFFAECILKKAQKQTIKENKKIVKAFNKKEAKLAFEKQEFKDLKKLVSEDDKLHIRSSVKSRVEEICNEVRIAEMEKNKIVEAEKVVTEIVENKVVEVVENKETESINNKEAEIVKSKDIKVVENNAAEAENNTGTKINDELVKNR